MPTRGRPQPARSVTTLTFVLLGIAVGALGVVLLALGGAQSLWGDSVVIPIVLSQIGSVLLAAVGLYAVWELIGRRLFTQELLEHFGLSSSVQGSGLIRIGTQYLEDAEWRQLIEGATTIDLFVAYAATWRKTHWESLRAAAARGAAITVYLPDVRVDPLIDALARRFSYTPEHLRDLIEETVAAYETLMAPDRKVRVRMSYVEPVYTCYRFDGTVVATLYNHSERQVAVPAIVCRRPGSLHDFFSNDLDHVAATSQPVDRP